MRAIVTEALAPLTVNHTQIVVTCEIKLLWNNYEIISMFYFTCNRVWNNFISVSDDVWNWHKIISAAERVLKLHQDYFSDIEHIGKHSWAAIILWSNFEIISGKFPRAEIKLFQTDVDKGWNNFFTCNHGSRHYTRQIRYRPNWHTTTRSHTLQWRFCQEGANRFCPPQQLL